MSTATMKAARYHAAKDIRVEETSIPSVNKNQVKIEVKYVGICGTDLHEYLHGPMIIPMKEPYPLNGHCGVTTMGHEFSGVVVEVGDDVHCGGVKAGDRVVVEPIFRNPDSVFTAKGEYNRSEPIGFIGLTGNGGFAKYVVVEDYMVHKIPDSVSFEQGALVEPAAVAVHAVKTSGLQLGMHQYPTVRSFSLSKQRFSVTTKYKRRKKGRTEKEKRILCFCFLLK
jgi:(R,R)-butanediol dehydrogenase/meso-butanediol dehydrogenase/diacetyl reductase